MLSFSARNLVKRYGGVVALADGNLDVQAGEVMALMGANGSGKSTLGKIITGIVSPDAGIISLNGEMMRFRDPIAARAHGIVAVYQELSLVPTMTAAENIWLAHEPLSAGGRVRAKETTTRTDALLQLFAGTIPATLNAHTPIAHMTPDERQIIEILKALSWQPRLLILDEATASLDSRQVGRLFELIQQWKRDGMAIVFISHRMDETFQLADRVTVMRNGQTVLVEARASLTEHDIIKHMIGESALATRTRSARDATHVQPLPVRVAVEDMHARMLRGVSLRAHDGEVLGLGGLQGQGQSDLLMAIFGALPFEGTLTISGQSAKFTQPRQAIKRKIALVPGDRNTEGLLPIRSIFENLLAPSWTNYGPFLDMGRAMKQAQGTASTLNIVMGGLHDPVSTLSGGNAQKVVIGKWLLRDPKLLLLNDPTKGVDVGAKAEFYTTVERLKEQGTAIILYSSEDEELLTLCDRVLVLHDGRISAELAGDSLNRASLVAASMGVAHAT